MAPRKNSSPDKAGDGSLTTKPRKKKSKKPNKDKSDKKRSNGDKIWNIEMVELDRIKPDPANVRLHDDYNLQTIEESLKEFDQHAPLVVQRSTGRIIIGNGRYEAMMRLGWKTALVHWVDDDDTKALRRAIVDNRSGELASWDEEALNEILGNFEFDGELDIPGFEDYLIPRADFDFNPILDPEQVGKEYTALDIDKANAKLLDQYSNGESRMIELVCPECGEVFYLRESDLPINRKEDS